MASYVLPFEKPVVDLENKLNDLRNFSENQDIDVSSEIERIQQTIVKTRQDIFSKLTPWQKVQVARHPMRPYTRDYITAMVDDFQELHGDRIHRDDHAIVGGFGRISGRKVMIIGTQKGRDTRSNLDCNFGCPYPEGYRKALRLMKIAARFNVPIVTLIDTPGAFPGIESEERHMAEAIAVNIRDAFELRVPMIACIIGEGGSGGALGIGVADRILILEHAYYSVISPEGCAAILWKDRAYAGQAAEALKLTAEDLKNLGLIDEILQEPLGGAHADPALMASTIKTALITNLDKLCENPIEVTLSERYDKFRNMGVFEESSRSSGWFSSGR